jgi:Carboxypeptidase regulatory-like domain
MKMDAIKSGLSIMSLVVVVLGFGLASLTWAQDDEGQSSNLRFVVVRDYNGKPVRNAAVVLHPVNRKGNQTKGGLELKTDNDGRTSIDGIPYGPLRIQVLVPGFQTFGEDYEVNKPELEITVKLKRPGQQYSVYGDTKKTDDKNQPGQKPQ